MQTAAACCGSRRRKVADPVNDARERPLMIGAHFAVFRPPVSLLQHGNKVFNLVQDGTRVGVDRKRAGRVIVSRDFA
jgi:hypothetical protein